MKILLVEDDANLREVTQRSLGKGALCGGNCCRLPHRITKDRGL